MNGKVALVTGGGTGIGAAVARGLAEAGASVAVSGRRRAPLEEVAGEIGGLAVPADATSRKQVAAAVAAVVERFGRLDVVVANAGVGAEGDLLGTDEDAWSSAWNGNVTSAFHVVREAMPQLIEAGGSVVVVSSLAGVFAGPQVLGYTTAKHALVGFTKSVARDYGPRGVRANVVCPGWVRTPMADEEIDALAEHAGCDREAGTRSPPRRCRCGGRRPRRRSPRSASSSLRRWRRR